MQQAAQLRQSIDGFDFEKAQTSVSSLFKTSVEWVLKAFKAQRDSDTITGPNALPIVLELNQILGLETIQMEHELVYQIAKTCRLFTECFVSQAIPNKHSIYQETKTKLLQNFDKVLGILPNREVAIRYELQSARAIVYVIPTDQYFFEKYISGIGETISDLSVNAAIKTLSQIKDDVEGHRTKKNWAYDVLNLSWISRELIESKKALSRLNSAHSTNQAPPNVSSSQSSNISGEQLHETDSEKLKQFYDAMKEYRTIPKVAFCAVEALAELADLAKVKNSIADFIQGSHAKPGLLTFINLKVEKKSDLKRRVTKACAELGQRFNKIFQDKDLPNTTLLRAEDPFWKVRYRAIQHLDELFPNLTPDLQKVTLQKIKAQFLQETDTLVLQTLEQFSKKHQASLGGPEEKKKISTKIEELKKQKTRKESSSSESSSTSGNEDDTLQSGGSEYSTHPLPSVTQDRELLELEMRILDAQLKIEADKLNYFGT